MFPSNVSATEHQPWSAQEKKAARSYLDWYIRMHKVPGKKACEEAQRNAAPALDKRSWRQSIV